MRFQFLIAATALLAVAAGPVLAEKPKASSDSSSSSQTSKAPTTIGGKTLKQWIAEIKKPDPSVRETAIRAVPYFEEPAKEAIPALVMILDKDTDAGCRVHACLAIIALAKYVRNDDVPNVVSSLIRRLDEGQAIVRFHAAIALGAMGDKASPAIPALVNRIYDRSSWEIRRAVIGALAEVGADVKRFGPDPRAVTAICSRLLATGDNEETSSQVRLQAVIALGSMGRPASDKEVVLVKKALDRATRDPDKSVVIWAYVADMAIDTKSNEPELSAVAKFLKGKDVAAKVQAAMALAAMREKAKSKIPDVIAMLDDEEPMAVVAAIMALGDFGDEAGRATDPLKKLMEKKDQNEYIKQMCKEALDKIAGKKEKRVGKKDR